LFLFSTSAQSLMQFFLSLSPFLFLFFVTPLFELSVADTVVAEKVFQRCWQDDDFLRMFNEPTCHLAWISHLKTARIVAVDHVFQLGGSGNDGSFRVVFADGSRAVFKACETHNYSWRAEAFAYFIDRGLQAFRAPGSVVRTLNWNDLFDLQPFGENKERLLKIQQKCSSDQEKTQIIGLMQGWTKYDFKLLNRGDKLFNKQKYKSMTPSIQHLEFSRLLMMLFVNGNVKNIFENVAQLQEPPEVVAAYRTSRNNADEGHQLLVSIDQGSAQWTRNDVAPPSSHTQPACNRERDQDEFLCKLDIDHDEKPNKIASKLLNFLGSACQFPRRVADAVQGHGQDFRPQLGVEVEARIRDLQGTEALREWTRFNKTVLDARVSMLSNVIDKCVAVYGFPNVVFEEFGARKV